ncbi:MAG: hypothetical protein A3G25_11490 [Betaproteobacteria bacterium RIFCSPLOWO2_12_FULL_63_13]|nr:MAG: hypothetical protein A3G25_11490 [Betaproteobacteria bacterium RIFCSPLOWO2_12_FULL_63_13]
MMGLPRRLQPLVSVVIPAFNAEPTLARAIDSVLAQTVAANAVEIVVCDDGSTDGTAAVLEGYGDRLIVVRQENKGRGAARNACLERAKGEFIAMLDADDWWVPTRLEAGLTAAAKRPDYDVFCANALVVDANGTIFRALNGEWHVGRSGWVFPSLLRANFVPFPTVLVRRTAVDMAGPFDETLPRTQDLEWLLRLAVHSRFHYDRTPLAWVDNRNWGTAEKQFDTYACFLRVLEKTAKGQPALVARHASMYRKSLSDCHSEIAAFWEQRGDHAQAAASYAAALEHTPGVRILQWRRCVALYRAGDFAACEQALLAVLAEDEYHVEARFHLGNVRLRDGRNQEAVEQYELALYSGYRYQKFPECLNNLAVALARLGETGRARELLEQALDQQCFYSDAMKNLDILGAGADPLALKWTARKVF